MRSLLFAFVFMGLILPARAEGKSFRQPPETMALSLERFADIALRNSLRSTIYRNSLESTDLSFRSSYISSRFPEIALQASAERSFSQASYQSSLASTNTVAFPDTSRTYGTQTNLSASLNLPLYVTGGSFSMGAMQSRNLTNTSGLGPATTETSPSWQASYTQPLFVFVGDGRRRNWKRTLLAHESSVASLDREKLAIWVDARALYYQAMQQQSTVEVELQTLRSSKELLNITRALTRVGRYAPVELNRAELRYALEERRIKSAQAALRAKLNNVKYFLQLPANVHFVLTTKLEYEKFDWELRDLINFALAHRQDYLNARRSLELQKLSVLDARETNRPNLSLVSSYSNARVLYNPGTPANTYGWTIQALATWNLFDFGVTRLKVKESLLELSNSRIALENIRQQVQTEVENAYINIKNLEEQLRDFNFNRKQAANNLKAVRYRYSNGIDRLIDVFDAENELRQLELEYLDLVVSYHAARDQMALSINGRLTGTY